jgi:hypothetical protein
MNYEFIHRSYKSETVDVAERYRDLCTVRFQNIVDVHVAVTLGIGHSLYMVRETK